MSLVNDLYFKPFFFLHKESEDIYNLSVIVPMKAHVCQNGNTVPQYQQGGNTTVVTIHLKYSEDECPNTIRWQRIPITLDGTQQDTDLKIRVKYPPLGGADDVGYVFTLYSHAQSTPYSPTSPHLFLQQKDHLGPYYLYTHIPVTNKKIDLRIDKGLNQNTREFELRLIDSATTVAYLFDKRILEKLDEDEEVNLKLISSGYGNGGIVQHDQADDKPFRGF